jgi:hypothetical protein
MMNIHSRDFDRSSTPRPNFCGVTTNLVNVLYPLAALPGQQRRGTAAIAYQHAKLAHQEGDALEALTVNLR